MGRGRSRLTPRLVPGWMAGPQLRRSELFSELEEEVNNQSFRQDDFGVLVGHPDSCNGPQGNCVSGCKAPKRDAGWRFRLEPLAIRMS